MVKSKKVIANCNICKTKLTIDIPTSVAEKREYYPFEYIHIHGDPEHALMLFLDQNLNLRDSMAYADLNIAKKQEKAISTLHRMTKNEAYLSIYRDPMRFLLFSILQQGVISEDALLEQLKKVENFEEQDFNILMIPLIRTGIVRSSWMQESLSECYFLIRDFAITREFVQKPLKIVLGSDKYSPFKKEIVSQIDLAITSYKQFIGATADEKRKEIEQLLEIHSNKDYQKIVDFLKDSPKPELEIVDLKIDPKILEKLRINRFILTIPIEGKPELFLFCELKMVEFKPEYTVNFIANRLQSKDITKEMAIKHLELLSDGETL